MKLKIKKSDKHIIIALMVFITISVSTTSIFFLIGGGVKTSQLSEVNASRIYVTPPNATVITNALDALGCNNNNGICSASSPKFLIDSKIILFDSNQNQIPISTYTNIPIQQSLFGSKLQVIGKYGGFSLPKLSLTDSSGNLLDLGSVQYKPFGVTNIDTNVIMTGQFAVYLDDVLLAHRYIATQGNTVNKTIPLYIDTQPAYTFTFADEGATWADKSVHIFKIVVGNVTATTGIGQNTQTFKDTNNALVYVLVMTVDQQKITSIGVDSKATAIFKSDDAVVTTLNNNGGYNLNTFCSNNFDGGGYATCNTSYTLPSVSVSSNGFYIPINTIPRLSNIVINVNGQTFTEITPVTQQTYTISCTPKLVTGKTYSNGGIDATTYADISFILHCTSNFGFAN